MTAVQIIEEPGSKLLYRSATGLEQAMADADAERLLAIYAEIIIDQWDPFAISANNLPYLAWAMGVNLWEDIWSVDTKRSWVARQWLFKSLRGTPAAFEMALAQSGYTITDWARPPQGFFASPDLTKAEWDAWIKLMPELRITFARRQGTRGVDEIFADATGFAGQDAVSIDDGAVLWGRYAVIRQNGVDRPVNAIEYHAATEQGQAVDFERYSSVGKSSLGVIADDVIADADYFVCMEESEPHLYTLRLDRAYSHDASTLGLTTTIPDLEAVSPRYERVSDIGNGGPFFFVDDFCEGNTFVDRVDGGDRLLADRIFLLDPDIVEPMGQGVSFADISRVGIEPYLAEIQIDLHQKEPARAIFAQVSFVEEAFAIPEDGSHQERALRAVVAAKALRDSVLVSFSPKRPIIGMDRVSDDMTYDDWVADPL